MNDHIGAYTYRHTAFRLARKNHAGAYGWDGNDRYFFIRACRIANVQPEAILDIIRRETAA